MKPAILADPALAPVLAALPRARLVGGCVRDTLARLPVTDIDLATPEPPSQVIEALEAAGLRTIPTGLAHGTITAISDGRDFEITTLRRDEQTDGRHAVVAWTDDWQQDAARRDFTINAMSLDQAGTLHDHFGGAEDLARGRVRFVGDPAQRIAEDRLRVLRYFRFLARYGREPPEETTLAAIAAAAPEMARLSAERVWSELKRILVVPDPDAILRLMERTGILAAIVPEATDTIAFARLVTSGAPADPMLRLAALLNGDANTAADRLKLSTAERDFLTALRSGPAPSPTDDQATLRRRLAETPATTLIGRTWLAQDQVGDWDALRAGLQTQDRPVFPLEGRDALDLGMQPGPAIGEALRAVRAWWLEGGCLAGKAACLERLCKYINLCNS